jgi:oxalate decarboxylase
MSEFTRRGFIGAAAATTGMASMMTATAGADEFTFNNNVPDPLLSGNELPTFKFELEKSKGKVIGNSVGKEATVSQLPISKGIAGVSMTLEPGAIREMHWHATAAEWAFVLEGRMRTTVIDGHGESEINDFEPGDIWYFPRGHGHMLQCVGDKPAKFILIFDNGYFSEFGTFSVTDWIGHAAPSLLAKSFGVPETAFAGLPKEEVYFARGPVVPVEVKPPLQGGLRSTAQTHKYRMLSQQPHSVHKCGREWRVDSSSFPISATVTGVILDLEPGGVRELHWHPNADEWQYVIDGQCSVSLFGSHGRYRLETLNKGDVGYIPQGYGHSIENTGSKLMRMLIGFNTGHYQAVDLSAWIASNPLNVLTNNFSKPEAFFEKFPKGDVFIGPPDHPDPRVKG